MVSELREMPTVAGSLTALAHASIAATHASIFNGYRLADSTMNIDANTAPLAEIEAARIDCSICIRTEYPETEEGCGAAFKICERIEEAMCVRFPEIQWNGRKQCFDWKEWC